MRIGAALRLLSRTCDYTAQRGASAHGVGSVVWQCDKGTFIAPAGTPWPLPGQKLSVAWLRVELPAEDS